MTGATHKLQTPGAEIIYYKCVDNQWYIWSRFEKEPYHWIKTYVSESLLVRIE